MFFVEDLFGSVSVSPWDICNSVLIFVWYSFDFTHLHLSPLTDLWHEAWMGSFCSCYTYSVLPLSPILGIRLWWAPVLSSLPEEQGTTMVASWRGVFLGYGIWESMHSWADEVLIELCKQSYWFLQGGLMATTGNLLNPPFRICWMSWLRWVVELQHQICLGQCKNISDRYGQTPRHLGQNIEMKRGNWLCPRCSFLNFARNMKCLGCEEVRPKR